MAGMWWKVPGGLLGIMAGGEAVAPEEAEVGTYPWFRGAMLRALKGNGFKNIAHGLMKTSRRRYSLGILSLRC